ncbi:MAG: NAD(P)H-dependent oxidoreductase, partial [Myxococcota bacterium]
SHDGFFVACPEYNGMPPPLLINTLDWLSRRSNEHEKPLAAFAGKVAALAAASPGNLGGLRSLPHLRSLLGNLGVTVVPKQVAIGSAMGAFDTNGQLTNTTQQAQLTALLDTFVALVQAVKGS